MTQKSNEVKPRVSISAGNAKMGTVKSVSLPPVVTCCNCEQCAKKCYARRIYRRRANVRQAYDNNLFILESDPAEYWKQLDYVLHFERYFRFHVSGDIVSADYFQNMVMLAVNNPHCEILAFTKAFDFVNSILDRMTVNGEKAAEGYYTLTKAFAAGECVEVCMEMQLKAHYLNGKIAFTYGPLTLAVDEHKATRELKKPVVVGEELSYKLLPAQEGEIVRIECKLADGDTLLLADYQSCGKKWLSDKPFMTVWFNSEE